jgi:hypothetical protein
VSDARALQRRVATGAALAGLGAALWFFIAWAFSSDRGLDFQDEGLYLLAGDPPSKTSGWVTPFGWSTAPFFRLVGHSIADFRTLGVWLAIVIGGCLGWVLGRWATHESPDHRWRVACSTTLAVIGGAGAPFYASSLLRTPNYNWVNLIGLAIGAIGAVVALHLPDGSLLRSRTAHLGASLLALGACFAVPSKPTSGVFLLTAAGVVVLRRLNRRCALRFAALVAGWGAAIVLLAVVTGLWPTTFISTLWRSTSFPPLHPNQTIPGAVKDVLRTPKVALQSLRQLCAASKALVGIAVVLAAVLRRRSASWWVRCTPLALVVVAAVGTEVPWPVLGGTSPAFRFAWVGTANADTLLLFGAALHLFVNWRHTAPTDRRRAVEIAVFTLVLAMAFSFGSAMGVYHQMGLATALLWLAAAVVVALTSVGSDRLGRVVPIGFLAVAALLMVGGNTLDSRHHPFGNLDLADQTTPVRVGAHDAPLLVDADTATFIDAVRTQARSAGFCNGTPLIGMAWSWSSTVPYMIGAKVPDELLLTLFGYDNAAKVLDVTMRFVHGPQWRDAWVLTTDPATIEASEAAELRAALDRLPAAIGRRFPADYRLAMDVDGTQLWRPEGVAAAACG